MSGRKRKRRELVWRFCKGARKPYLARSHRECPFCHGPPAPGRSFARILGDLRREFLRKLLLPLLFLVVLPRVAQSEIQLPAPPTDVVFTIDESAQGRADRTMFVEAQKSDTFKLAGKMVWVTSIADLVGTEVGIAKGDHERNPFLRNRAARISIKISTAYVANRMSAYVADRGHRKSATIFRWFVVGAFAFATGNNIVIISF